MEKVSPPTDLLELTLEALKSWPRREDWDWIVCFHIKEWEARNADEYMRSHRRLLHGHFAWYHWHDICEGVLGRARAELAKPQSYWTSEELWDPENYRLRWQESRRICTEMIAPECQREFANLAQAVAEHELDLYEKAAERR